MNFIVESILHLFANRSVVCYMLASSLLIVFVYIATDSGSRWNKQLRENLCGNQAIPGVWKLVCKLWLTVWCETLLLLLLQVRIPLHKICISIKKSSL